MIQQLPWVDEGPSSTPALHVILRGGRGPAPGPGLCASHVSFESYSPELGSRPPWRPHPFMLRPVCQSPDEKPACGEWLVGSCVPQDPRLQPTALV